ncbi:hypothetical protein ACIBKY_52015 [Nonomuraea sp. NPDC050394]|uniref:hypothetical protein n=1 Tax=Nonomuraea sp. NPDC050394 TaxID=3364363 RepID=UPI0037BD187E
MTTVHGTIHTPAGVPARGASVEITLVDLAGRPTTGLTGDVEVLGHVYPAVSEDGEWSATLTPSADITSSTGDTLYRLVERVSTGASATSYLSVPASGTHWAGDLVVTLPGAVAPEQLVGYLPLSGGTLTGPLTLAGAPDEELEAATRGFVLSNGGAGGGGGGGAVSSVNGFTGDVELDSADIGADPAGTAAAAVTVHEADTTAVHGIADTSALETTSGSAAKVATHTGAADPHGDRAHAAGLVSTHEGAGNPHPVYLTGAEGDAAYSALGHNHAGVYEPSGTASAAVTAHEAAGDPHPGYLTASEGNAAYATLSHIHPPKDVYPASAYGLLAMTGDPMAFMNNSSFGVNTVMLTRVLIPAGAAITNVWVAVRTAGTHDASTPNNQIAIYDDTGTLVAATADAPTLWTGSGWRGAALVGGPIAAQASDRYVYVAALARGITGCVLPHPSSANDNQVVWFCRPAVGTVKRRALYISGQTSLPASFDPSAGGTETTFALLAGVS